MINYRIIIQSMTIKLQNDVFALDNHVVAFREQCDFRIAYLLPPEFKKEEECR